MFSCVCGVEPPVCRSTACACVPACVLSVPVLCVWTCVVPLSLHGSVALGCQGRGSATGLAPPAPSDYEQGGRTHVACTMRAGRTLHTGWDACRL